jgi:hypothetical protein
MVMKSTAFFCLFFDNFQKMLDCQILRLLQSDHRLVYRNVPRVMLHSPVIFFPEAADVACDR